jgi:hypothetical protein
VRIVPDTSPVSVIGIDGAPVTLPGDLAALLDYDPAVAGWLVTGGIETVRELLEVPEAEIQMVPRIGPNRARRIARCLRERWGVEPGCLARTHNPKDRVDAAIAAANSFIRRSRSMP